MTAERLIFTSLEQGTPEWLQARCGILTASTVKNILTPKKQEISKLFTETVFFRKKLLERVTGMVSDVCDTSEPYKNDVMLEGHSNEDWALKNYEEHFEEINRIGFILIENKDLKYKMGFSPDAITENYFIEVKSRAPELHLHTIRTGKVPDEFMAQIQAGLLVTDFKYAKFISWPRMSEELAEKNPMPAIVIKVYRDEEYIAKIEEAAIAFEEEITKQANEYSQMLIDIPNYDNDTFYLMPSFKEYTKIISLDDL